MADQDIFQLRLAQIQQLEEGQEKEQALADLYRDYPVEMQVLESQMAEGEYNLTTQQPEGRQAGRVYVAANPLEHLAAALRQGYGGYQQSQARAGLTDIAEARQRARTGMAQALMDYSPMNEPNAGPQPQMGYAGGSTASSSSNTGQSQTPVSAPSPAKPVTPPVPAPQPPQPPQAPNMPTPPIGPAMSTMEHAHRPNQQRPAQPLSGIDPNLLDEEQLALLQALRAQGQ